MQADPIRAPARAQDLTLRHRVKGYRAGDLERRYAALDVEEDFFVNYGFVPRALHALMHPRAARRAWTAGTARRRRRRCSSSCASAARCIRARSTRTSRTARVTNYWGGSSNATTHLLDGMHYRGLLRVVRREAGIRHLRGARARPGPLDAADAPRALDALVDVVVGKYAPLPGAEPDARGAPAALRRAAVARRAEAARCARAQAAARARARRRRRLVLAGGRATGVAQPARRRVRLLAPFDPVVWDRRRFELFWGWAYRFEAYTPRAEAQARLLRAAAAVARCVIGWGNLAFADGRLTSQLGYVSGSPPKDPVFRRALEAELASFETFLLRPS